MKNKKEKKRRNLFMSFTLMTGFFTFAFKFDKNNITWMWQNQIQVSVILAISATVFGILWFTENQKIKYKK